MKKYLSLLILGLFILSVWNTPGYSENRKLAQTGMKFLSVALDARSSALSGALTAMEGNSTAMFFNPSGMANMGSYSHVSLGQVKWIADIDYVYGTAAIKPMNGQLGVFGVSFMSVNYGDLIGTIRADNDQGFLETGNFSPSAYAIGLGYAKSLTNKFSIGGHMRYVSQNLTGGITDFGVNEAAESENFTADVIAFDFGLMYKTGFKSLAFGMNVRNFSEEIEYVRETFQLPLLFEIGISMNMIDFIDMDPEMHSVMFAVDYLHPRDFEEQLDIGMEYIFRNTFALRAGYTAPTDEQGVSLGAGVNQNFGTFGLGIDYAYTPFGVFDSVHRFSFQFTF